MELAEHRLAGAVIDELVADLGDDVVDDVDVDSGDVAGHGDTGIGNRTGIAGKKKGK